MRFSGCLPAWCRESDVSFNLRPAPNADQAKSLPTHLSFYAKTHPYSYYYYYYYSQEWPGGPKWSAKVVKSGRLPVPLPS